MGGYTRLDYLKAPHCCSFTNTQCGKFRHFLPLRFSVKLIFGILEVQKIPIFAIFETLDFDFLEISALKRYKNVSESKFKVAKHVKKVLFEFKEMISRKIGVAEIF